MRRPFYRAEELTDFAPEGDLGYPGQYPFTRGIRPTMYRGRLWTMRQYSGMGDAEQSNQRYKFLLAPYGGAARRSGAEFTQLSGTVQNDILKEYIARGTYIYPLAPGLRLVTDLFAWTGQHLPRWNPISISGYHMREAGATAVQEVAFSLANGRAYLDALGAAGLDLEQSAMRFSFFFSAHNDFFEEVAKFRAARRLWARVLRERFGLDCGVLRFHAQTAGSTLTAQQPEHNLARP